MERHINRLIDFSLKIKEGKGDKEAYNAYLEEINAVVPQDVFKIMNEQLKMGISPKEALSYVDKLVNIFYKPLSAYQWRRPEEGTFLYYLMAENDGMKAVLEEMRTYLKERDYEKNRQALLLLAIKLKDYNGHMQKLENILFPYMEQKKEEFDGLKIMWALHDEARKWLSQLIQEMENPSQEAKTIYVTMGEVFFAYSGLVQKQELIMFPSAAGLFDEETFIKMHEQSFDYGFPFIVPPTLNPSYNDKNRLKEAFGNQVIQTPTGALSFDQVELLINALPVDVTFVDAHDKVAFFSRPKDRIFPRSPAIIGRDVRNCHPPESVHVVEEIVEAFKEGSKDDASFWIQMKGMFILIQYFALRDEEGCYKGTLEVSQEISSIRSLTGEKRLLDWDKEEETSPLG